MLSDYLSIKDVINEATKNCEEKNKYRLNFGVYYTPER